MSRTAFEHVRQQRERELHRRAHVDVDRTVQLSRRERRQPAGGRNRRICDEHVEVRPLAQPVDVRSVGQIRADHLDPRTEVARDLVEHVHPAGGQHEPRAPPVQGAGNRTPDASRRAGDQHGALFEIDRHLLRSAKK
jgi:hypothetical protein